MENEALLSYLKKERMKEGKYGLWELIADAEEIGLELNLHPLTARHVGQGFIAGFIATYKGARGMCGITMGPRIYLVSFANETENTKTLFGGFAKLYNSNPAIIYKDKENKLITAEFWTEFNEAETIENLEQILTDENYEIQEIDSLFEPTEACYNNKNFARERVALYYREKMNDGETEEERKAAKKRFEELKAQWNIYHL